jgi:hypothetical protein
MAMWAYTFSAVVEDLIEDDPPIPVAGAVIRFTSPAIERCDLPVDSINLFRIRPF